MEGDIDFTYDQRIMPTVILQTEKIASDLKESEY